MLAYFFFTITATTYIYTLSLHDALPIYPNFLSGLCGPVSSTRISRVVADAEGRGAPKNSGQDATTSSRRSEEHTSELQSHSDLVCRLLLEKKKKLCMVDHLLSF